MTNLSFLQESGLPLYEGWCSYLEQEIGRFEDCPNDVDPSKGTYTTLAAKITSAAQEGEITEEEASGLRKRILQVQFRAAQALSDFLANPEEYTSPEVAPELVSKAQKSAREKIDRYLTSLGHEVDTREKAQGKASALGLLL